MFPTEIAGPKNNIHVYHVSKMCWTYNRSSITRTFIKVSRDGRGVEGLSTHRKIGTGATEDKLVTEDGQE